jgi:large subunit ribosomal protein L17
MKALATALFQHKKIVTTEAKAKELRPYAEKLISKAKHALQRETSNQLPDGQKVDVHTRRVVGRYIRSKAVLQELFDVIAPAVADRPGGFTRIVKTGNRRGDGGKAAIIELVVWAAPLDGNVNLKSKKKVKAKKETEKGKAVEAKEKPVKDTPVVEEHIAIVEEKIAEPIVFVDEAVAEEPIAEAEGTIEATEETAPEPPAEEAKPE